MPGMTLPPGFRFHPTDEELVDHYLTNRVKGIPLSYKVIADVDLYKCEPWDLPSKSSLPQVDHEWFFFSPRDRKYPNGSRTNRATEAGYWKATGRDRTVKKESKKTIGMKKTLVFYRGRAPHGERTDWLMHEYRLDGEDFQKMNVPQDAFVLCRVFKKNGFGPPKNPSGGSGSMEEVVDQVDSPGEVKSSPFSENDVKPSMTSLANLAPLSQQLSSPQEGLSENHIMNGVVDNFVGRSSGPFMDDLFVPNENFTRPTRSSEADNSEFSLDEGLEKRNHQKLLDDFYAICPPLDGGGMAPLEDLDPYTDIPGLIDSTKIVRTEFNNKWQEQVAYQEQVNGVYNAWDGVQSLPKHEEQLIFPTHYENDFGPLPTLVQLPSPPTQTSFDDNDTESSSTPSSNNHFTTFQRRTRPSVISPIAAGGYSSPYTAKRRVLLQHRGPVTVPIADLAAEKPSEAKSSLVLKAETVELKLSSDTQATSAEESQVDSEVANRQDSTWATNVITAPLSDDSSDDRGDDVSRSSVSCTINSSELAAGSPIQLIKPVSAQPVSDDTSSVHKVSSDASPPRVDVGSRDFESGNVREKQESVSEIESGHSSAAHASTSDVDKSNCHSVEPTCEAAVFNQGETPGYLKKGYVNNSEVMRHMGLGLFEPISALRPADLKSTGRFLPASLKKQVTSRELPAGIGSIHVNAVTVTCSCSSAGRPHVPTKACACYPTFWEGRCEKDTSTKQDCSEAERSETRDEILSRFKRHKGFECLLLLLVVHMVCSILEYRRGHYSFLLHFGDSDFSERFFSSLPRLFRDLLFATFGAMFLYLFQRRSVPWRSIFTRTAVNSEPSSASIF